MIHLTHRWPQSGHFFPKLGQFFPVCKKGYWRPPPLPLKLRAWLNPTTSYGPLWNTKGNLSFQYLQEKFFQKTRSKQFYGFFLRIWSLSVFVTIFRHALYHMRCKSKLISFQLTNIRQTPIYWKDRNRFTEWFALNANWQLWNIFLSEIKSICLAVDYLFNYLSC